MSSTGERAHGDAPLPGAIGVCPATLCSAALFGTPFPITWVLYSYALPHCELVLLNTWQGMRVLQYALLHLGARKIWNCSRVYEYYN